MFAEIQYQVDAAFVTVVRSGWRKGKKGLMIVRTKRESILM